MPNFIELNMRLIALAGLLMLGSSAAGSWSAAAPIPERLQEHHGALLGGRIYIAGGIDSTNETTRRAYRYDPRRDSWERIADLPEPRHHMPLVVANDTLYAVGGFDGLQFTAKSSVWIYRADRNAWESRAPLPRPRGATAAGVVAGRIVVVGGYGAGRELLDTTVVYDPATNALDESCADSDETRSPRRPGGERCALRDRRTSDHAGEQLRRRGGVRPRRRIGGRHARRCRAGAAD